MEILYGTESKEKELKSLHKKYVSRRVSFTDNTAKKILFEAQKNKLQEGVVMCVASAKCHSQVIYKWKVLKYDGETIVELLTTVEPQ